MKVDNLVRIWIYLTANPNTHLNTHLHIFTHRGFNFKVMLLCTLVLFNFFFTSFMNKNLQFSQKNFVFSCIYVIKYYNFICNKHMKNYNSINLKL